MSRQILRGVRIEPIAGGGVWMIATNGAVMLIQRDHGGHADHPATLAATAPIFIPDQHDDEADVYDHCWSGKNIAIPALEPGKTVAAPEIGEDGETGLHVLIERMVGRFPDWRKAIGESPQRPDLNRDLEPTQTDHSAFSASLIDLLIRQRSSFLLHGNLEDINQMFVTYTGDPDSLGVLMKCIIKGDECQLGNMLTAIGWADLAAQQGST